MARAIYRHPWRVVCPDGKIRAYRAVNKRVAGEVAFQKSVDGCRKFPDDPTRWWKTPCPGGKHGFRRGR